MKLYLVQHGEACAKEVNPERPLTDQGKLDVEQLAGFLKRSDIQLGRVMHSGKLRARQTAECLANAIASGVALEINGQMNPNDNPQAFDWQGDSSGVDTLIVGHLPFMAKLVSHLLIEDVDSLITAFQPGSVVCLEQTNDACWQINWMIRPELFR